MSQATYSDTQCPACGSGEVLRLSMTLHDQPVEFFACNECEWKGWERQGESVPLKSVLPLIAHR